jgi:hypothetical protein
MKNLLIFAALMTLTQISFAQKIQGKWLVDENKNKVRIENRKLVQEQIKEHGFQVVFNHYAGISDGTPNPLSPKPQIPTRKEGEGDAEYARRVLRAVNHPAANDDDQKAIFIASVIIKRENNR